MKINTQNPRWEVFVDTRNDVAILGNARSEYTGEQSELSKLSDDCQTRYWNRYGLQARIDR